MKYTERSLEKIHDDIGSASKSFIGLHMEDILIHIQELENGAFKSKYILNIYNNQNGFYDNNISGTRVRVNAVLRIVKANQVLYALGQIDSTSHGTDENAVIAAEKLIERIKTKEIALPVLQ